MRLRAEEWRQAVVPNGQADDVALAVVPSNDRATSQLPVRRRNRVVDHLKRLIEENEPYAGELHPGRRART